MPGVAMATGPGWGILHAPALVEHPTPELFQPGHWSEREAGRAGRGRGVVHFVAAGAAQWALRHYRRGGLAGRVISDRYLWLGAERTRAFREWRMLQRLWEAGLPVPRPVAAGWRRSGLAYSADLATVRIPGAQPLSGRLAAGGAIDWEAIGRTLADFHRAGACHADLNAHNVLLDEAGRAWLLDFDRGRFLSPGSWQRRNLERLQRSLRKIAGEPGAAPFDPVGWESLLSGYRGALGLRASAP